ncbi:STT3B-like protein [Mya arenaria]|uniref:dolichyl-diphosphooligosaccharide--protein glycotransferase n=1 Tax=Mya arenaria TaxID=6604 RepID=A0ABY7E7R7_MYAAR|nr:STT3B-like protein [Mya arenaria]
MLPNEVTVANFDWTIDRNVFRAANMADTGMKTDISTTMFNPGGWKSLISFSTLALAWLVGFSSRLFAVIRFESIIHEFDPWFNYRATHYMVNHGFYNFLNCGMTAVSVYLFTKEIWSAGAGLFAACFIAIVPGYISRSIKSVKTGSLFWAVFTALSYFYMVSAWGGYVFIINLIPLHVLVLIIMGRYSRRIYVAYNSFFIIGLILSMQVPFVGFNPISTSEHMASAGFIHPWSGRFYSLWDTGYAKIHIPIIASVSEHQPTTWVSFFFDLHILVCAFPVVVLYAVFASYFAGVMVRLMLTLTPIVCVAAAIAFSRMFEIYLKDDTPKTEKKTPQETQENKPDSKYYDKEQDALGINIKSIIVIALLMSRSILDDFREAYYWLRQNTDDKARVMSWWDYGYQIAGMGNKTTLVDNNTWNNSHIALVGKAMSSNESAAYEIMRALDVNYVLVIFGGVIGYSGDDINKFLWMVRIAEGEHPKDIRESDYFTPQGEFRVDSSGSKTLLNCLMYKLSYYRFGELQLDFRSPAGYDRTRGVEIGNKNFDLTHLEEAYTSEHWLVRIYRVLDLENRQLNKEPVKPVKKSRKSNKKKSGKKKAGSIKNKPKIVKGKKPKSKK